MLWNEVNKMSEHRVSKFETNSRFKMDAKTSEFRISVDATIGSTFTAVFTSFYGRDKVSQLEFEGFNQCSKDVWHNFISKRMTSLSFARNAKGQVSLTWEETNLVIVVTTGSQDRHATAMHYFPADFMVDALTKLVDLME